MQASISSLPKPFLSTKTSPLTITNTYVKHQQSCMIKSSTSISMIKAAPSDAPQDSMQSSVFPAEACETLGGVACDVEMFPETKLKQEPKSNMKVTTETVDREYLQYDNPKTVFITEACDDLGGEFCEPAYQSEAN